MTFYAIIETDTGLTVTEVEPGTTAEEAARRNNAVLIDPGPYKSYDDAYEALMALPEDEEEKPE